MDGLQKRQKGDFYEDRAVEYLELQHYTVIQRNFRVVQGEIDIIARDKKYCVFIEVKARKVNALVSGKEAITAWKKARITKAACVYAAKNDDQFYRFDVLEIIQGRMWREYNLIKDAFMFNET